MQAQFFYNIMQISLFWIIPSQKFYAIAFAIVYGLIRKLGIGNQPAFIQIASYATVVEHIAAQIVKTRFYIKRYFQIRFHSQFIVKFGLNHKQFVLIPSHHIYLMSHTSPQEHLIHHSLIAPTLENPSHIFFKRKTVWPEFRKSPANRI